MTADLLIRHGCIVNASERFHADVVVNDGRVTAFLAPGTETVTAAKEVDASGQYVLPGLIDSDVNFRDPGLDYKETWESGCGSAAAGGVTTVLVMPNSGQPVIDEDSLGAQLDRAHDRSLVNYGFKAAVVPENLGRLGDLALGGVIGFRFSMAGRSGAIPPLSDLEMVEAFGEIARTGLRCGVHAENRAITEGLTARANEDNVLIRDLGDVRPPYAELEAVQRILLFAQQSEVKLVIYHISTRESLAVALRQREHMGERLLLQTNTHYAMMNSETMIDRCGPALAMFPPIRSQRNQQEILSALEAGNIDILGSDHSPHAPEEKNYGLFDRSVGSTTPGWPGVETSAAVMLGAVNDGALSLERFVAAQSENPAKAWGMYPRKGRIAVGWDADLTLVSLDMPGRVDEADLKTKHRKTNWDGWQLSARPTMTIVGGEIVAHHGELITDRMPGRLVRGIATN
jgi:dihydroorotase (multifunctional complex type)